MATREGVFVEPASAAGVAGLLARSEVGGVEPGQTITVTVTGHGLKDIDTPLEALGELTEDVVQPDIDEVAAAAGLSGA